MKVTNEGMDKLQETLIQREQQERLALATAASKVLSHLNITIENLPQKHHLVLHELCTLQAESQVEHLDLDGLSLCRSEEKVKKLDDEYEILKLKQKNKELQVKIDRNAQTIEQLRRDLSQSKCSLHQRTPNPENVEEYCRQMRQKVASYDESCKRAKAKYLSLAVPSAAMPSSLLSLATSLEQLSEEAASLRQRAEDVQLARRARDTLRQLRK